MTDDQPRLLPGAPLCRDAEITGRSGQTYGQWLRSGTTDPITGHSIQTYEDFLHEFLVHPGETLRVTCIRNPFTNTWCDFDPPLTVPLEGLDAAVAEWQDVLRDGWAQGLAGAKLHLPDGTKWPVTRLDITYDRWPAPQPTIPAGTASTGQVPLPAPVAKLSTERPTGTAAADYHERIGAERVEQLFSLAEEIRRAPSRFTKDFVVENLADGIFDLCGLIDRLRARPVAPTTTAPGDIQ